MRKTPASFSREVLDVAATDVSTGKLIPQNVEAEQFILGSILLENDALLKTLEIINADSFYRETHRKVFAAMLELFERNEPIDLLTLTERLKKNDTLNEVGGASYLAEMMNMVPTAANVRHHARIVREKGVIRRLINVATEIVSQSYEDNRDVDEMLDIAEQKIFEIAENRVAEGFIPVDKIMKESFKTIEQLFERKELVTGIPTGFADFDRLTSGLQPSDLVIIAGRPSMGKTAFALNVAQHAALNHKYPVAIFSMEMSRQQVALRLLCSEARVDSSRLRSGYLDKTDWPKLTLAAGVLSEAPIFIDDMPGLTALDIRAKARRLQKDRGLALIIVDYLQLMRGRGDVDNRQQEIADITRSLKGLAKELNVPVVALSQLSRAVEQRQGSKPQLSDLRESGAIEQDADLVAFLYRAEVYGREDVEGQAELIIGKQRNGPVGSVSMTFLKQYTRFENFSPKSEMI
jgi:replicative DNA helicase